MYKILAKINKIILPSLTRKRVDVYKLTKLQKILLAYRCFVTKKSLK